MKTKNLKILVLGGMHGNELLGIEVVKLLRKKPLLGVDAIIANPQAVKKSVRFTESDLNRSFGNDLKNTYERRRARQLKKLCQSYDLVLDFHNTQTPNNNCSFVGIDCQSRLFTASKQLGLERCVQATYDCVNKHCLNTLSIEISQQDRLDDARYWYEQVKKLQTKTGLPNKPLSVYRFVRRVTWEEMKGSEVSDWQPFKPLSQLEKAAFGLQGEIVPIFIGSTLTEYYATLLRKEKR